jgi:acetyl-CoA acetyltransferase
MERMFPLESMGETGENVAERYGVSRAEQDEFGLSSHRRWTQATTRVASTTSSCQSESS